MFIVVEFIWRSTAPISICSRCGEEEGRMRRSRLSPLVLIATPLPSTADLNQFFAVLVMERKDKPGS